MPSFDLAHENCSSEALSKIGTRVKNVRQTDSWSIHAGTQVGGYLSSQVRAGQSVAFTAKALGIPKASLSNWVRLSAKGVLSGGGDKPVAITAEHMELARLRAEVFRLCMENDIAKKAAAYFAKDTLRSTPGFSK